MTRSAKDKNRQSSPLKGEHASIGVVGKPIFRNRKYDMMNKSAVCIPGMLDCVTLIHAFLVNIQIGIYHILLVNTY